MNRRWVPLVLAALVAAMGVVNVLSALTPSLAGGKLAFLEQELPLSVRHGGHLTAAMAGFALLALAHSLGRRKRIAWVVALGALGVSVASHLVKGPDYAETLFAAGLIAALWFSRAHFHARSDRPSIWQGVGVLAGALAFTLVYGAAGFFLLDRHYNINFGLWAALRQTLVMFTQYYDPGLTPVTAFGSFFADSIYAVGALTLTYAAWMLMRPVLVRQPATAGDRERAGAIVERFGHTSLARFVLFDDKHYLFSEGGAVIGYVLVGGAAVALGDPIGPAEDTLPSIEAFAALCRVNDWLPVFYQTQPDTLALYQRAGFDALCIGHEAIIRLDKFSLAGGENKGLRSHVNKLTKAGHRFVVEEPPISDDLLRDLRAISDEWLTMMHGSEKRFSLGWFDDDYIRQSSIGAVITPAGEISAFVNLIPEYQANEIAIDLMRRRQEIENGTMEYLFVSLFQWAQARGYERFNLGLSALAGVGEQADDPVAERIMHWVYEYVDQFYNFKGLHAFKEKFRPEWSPRYLIYPGPATLAQAWVAVVRANSGDSPSLMGFLEKIGVAKTAPPR